MKSALAMFAALSLASPVAPVEVSTPVSSVEWKAMLARAQSGGVINLGKRPVEFARQVFQPTRPVTIRGGVFGPIVLDKWRNVTFDGARFAAQPGTPDYTFLLVADDPHNLTIRNAHFSGYATPDGKLHVRGPSVRGGSDVTIEKSTFEDLAGYVNFVRTEGGKFTDNNVRRVREGLNIVGASEIAIERNLFEDLRPYGGDHADAVQFFTTGLTRPGDAAAHDIVLRDNLILANGRAQGLFAGDELKLSEQGRGYQRFLIEGNVIVGVGWHGITVQNGQDIVVRNNRLFRVRGVDSMDSRIAINGGTATVVDNEANAFIFRGEVQEDDNAKVGASSPARVNKVVAEWMARFRPGQTAAAAAQ